MVKKVVTHSKSPLYLISFIYLPTFSLFFNQNAIFISLAKTTPILGLTELLLHHSLIHKGDTPVILPIRNGINVAQSEYFMMDELSDDMITTIDSLGGFLVPSVFRNQYRLEPDDILTIFPNETCI